MRFLYAVRHVERRPASDTQRGRPGRWPREELMKAAGQLRGILERETQGRVSLNSFIGQYLPVIEFPSDVTDALCSGRVNLQEAAQLARLTPKRLNCSPRAARERRAEVLQSHLAVQGSQTRLRAWVKELLGESKQPEISEGLPLVVTKVDELLEIDPADTRHMFWEEMKRLFFAMREVEPEDLDDETMDDFLKAMDQVSNVLQRIEKRRQARAQTAKKLTV
jgi:glucose-6-phosphate isomerase